MTTGEEAIAWIHGRLKFGSRPGLTRINELLKRLDNPQDKIRTVHIGGTNGKGSTVTFLRCLLEEQGLTVGTFTSPYIVSFNERISINNQPISNLRLVAQVNKIYPIVMEMDKDPLYEGLTEFEIITAIMFSYFAEEKIDIALIEVGLGGTYDCTNVITPLVSGIVTIGYDHMDILGNSIEEIAEQKAGIIKPHVPVVTGNIESQALKVIEEVAKNKKSPIYRYGKEFQGKYQYPAENWGEVFTFSNLDYIWKDLNLSMVGRHQIENASLAIELFLLVCPMLSISFQMRDIQRGLNKANWPGRMEKISEEPLIILDGAHNEPAIKRLVETIKSEFFGKEIYILFSALSTKEIQPMLHLLKGVPNHKLVATTFTYPTALSAKEIAEKATFSIGFNENWQLAFRDTLYQMDQSDVLFITGSLYFISEVRQFITEEKGK